MPTFGLIDPPHWAWPKMVQISPIRVGLLLIETFSAKNIKFKFNIMSKKMLNVYPEARLNQAYLTMTLSNNYNLESLSCNTLTYGTQGHQFI